MAVQRIQMRNIVIDLSGYCREAGLEKALSGAVVRDLSALEGTNCYCDGAAAAEIRSAIAELPAAALHWDDTGDYHYLSRFWLEKVAAEMGDDPFALVLFDHHPDMQEPAFGQVLSCGGWARDAFQGIPNLTQVLMVGVNPDLELEILDLVFDGVLAVTSEDLRHTGDGLSAVVLEMFSLLEPRIPIYVSVDLDVLTTEYARTDWDQGRMTLAQLEAAVLRATAGHRLLGADVCGGLTRAKGASDSDMEINLKTSKALEKLFANLIID
jgi:hypothetical protein